MHRIVWPLCLALTACTGGDPDPKDSGDDSGDDSDIEATCIPEDDLTAIGEHFSLTVASVGLLPGHASASEALMMFVLPAAWDVTGTSFFSLFMPCEEATTFDQWCDSGVCWQLECIEPSPGWEQRAWLQSAMDNDGWSYASADASVSWTESEDVVRSKITADIESPWGSSFDLDSDIAIDGVDGSFTMAFPELLDGHDTVLSAEIQLVENGSHSGEITVDGETVATLVGIGSGWGFEPAGACAE